MTWLSATFSAHQTLRLLEEHYLSGLQAEEQARKLAKEAADAARREDEKAARAAAAAQYRDADWIAESAPDESRSDKRASFPMCSLLRQGTSGAGMPIGHVSLRCLLTDPHTRIHVLQCWGCCTTLGKLSL